MISEEYKKRAKELVKKAQEKGLITKYSEWCKTEEAKEYALSEEEVLLLKSHMNLQP